MLIYYIILAFILLFAFPMCIYKPSILKKRIYVITVFSVLYFIAAFRYGTGNDYFNYIKIFNQYRESANFSEALQIVSEPAFSLLNWVLSRFTNDIILINSVYSFIILVPVAYVIMEQSKNVWLSCFLYICLTFFYTTLNFTRQSMAASFIFLAFFLFGRKKFLLAVLSVILAVCFHMSAFIFIPVFLLCLIKPEKYLFIAYTVLTAVCYFAVDMLFDLGANILSVLINPRFSVYIGSRFTQGLGWQYILLPLLCFIIIYMAYHTNWRTAEKDSVLYVNLSFFSAVIWFFITKIMILERFSMYFYIFAILSIPSAVDYFLGNFDWLGKRVVSKIVILNNSYNKREKIIFANKKTQKSIKIIAKTDYDNEGINVFKLTSLDKNGYYARKMRKKQIDGNITIKNNIPPPKINKALCYSIFGVYTLSCLIYHSYGLVAGFHGIVPYSSGISNIERWSAELGGRGKINLLYDAGSVYEYFSLLTGKDVTVLVSGIPSEKPYLDSVTRATLKKMGFEYDFKDLKSDCIIAVFQNGKKLYEKSGNERLEYVSEILGKEIYLSSDLNESQIVIDGAEKSLGNVGLNFIVLDDSGRIISTASVYHNDVYGNTLTNFKLK